MRFRKRPVEIEAVQYLGHNVLEVSQFLIAGGANFELGIRFFTIMRAEPGDWIIKGVAGEFYPCKPDIFAETYEPVGDQEDKRES